MNSKNADDIACVEAPSTRLVYSDEEGYIEVTKNGVIGVGTGKWPGWLSQAIRKFDCLNF